MVARLLGVNKSTAAQLERGAKQPSGPTGRLLELLDPKRHKESPVVGVQRAMAPAPGSWTMCA